MAAITRESLLTLEAYAKERAEFRARVLAHKKARTVHLGEHVTLLFEDELTVRYQIQEMLRIEKTFEEAGIRDELDAYNPLVPDGTNFKATMLIEYEDVDERRVALARLRGIERRVWVEVDGIRPRLRDRRRGSRRARTTRRPRPCISCASSSTPAMIAALKRGAALGIGIDHPAYAAAIPAVARRDARGARRPTSPSAAASAGSDSRTTARRAAS